MRRFLNFAALNDSYKNLFNVQISIIMGVYSIKNNILCGVQCFFKKKKCQNNSEKWLKKGRIP